MKVCNLCPSLHNFWTYAPDFQLSVRVFCPSILSGEVPFLGILVPLLAVLHLLLGKFLHPLINLCLTFHFHSPKPGYSQRVTLQIPPHLSEILYLFLQKEMVSPSTTYRLNLCCKEMVTGSICYSPCPLSPTRDGYTFNIVSSFSNKKCFHIPLQFIAPTKVVKKWSHIKKAQFPPLLTPKRNMSFHPLWRLSLPSALSTFLKQGFTPHKAINLIKIRAEALTPLPSNCHPLSVISGQDLQVL